MFICIGTIQSILDVLSQITYTLILSTQKYSFNSLVCIRVLVIIQPEGCQVMVN